MALVQLTEITFGEHHPWGVNPDHVATIRPRKTITPIDAQQDPRGMVSYDGTIIELASGEQHFVAEDFDVVHELLVPTPEDMPQLSAEAIRVGQITPEDLPEDTVLAGPTSSVDIPEPPPAATPKKAVSHHKKPPAPTPEKPAESLEPPVLSLTPE